MTLSKDACSYRALSFRLLAGVAVLYAVTQPAAAQFASQIRLSSLDGTTGFQLNGEAAGDQIGFAVSSAGDVNGDGLADLIASTLTADTNGGAAGTFQGASYVVFGRATGFASVIELSSLDGTTGFKLAGTVDGGRSGASASAAGDVNGDGFGDLVVGAPFVDGAGVNQGAAYVVFGKASGFASVIDVSNLDGTNGFQLNGAAAGDQIGSSVSSAGDVNKDGFADLIVGAPFADANGAAAGVTQGASYVVLGKASGFASVVELSGLNGATGFKLSGSEDSDQSGISVSMAGDVNGDGFADLIIGARFVDTNGAAAGSIQGASYVVFGKASGFASEVQLSSLNGTTGFQLKASAGGGRSGSSVSTAGDINGDGFADVIIGAYTTDTNGGATGFDQGASYVVFGKPSGFASVIDLSSLDGTTGFQLIGEASGDRSGTSVASAGDVNGDGFADLILGAPNSDSNGLAGGVQQGSSYVVFGKPSGFAPVIALSEFDGASSFRLAGEADSDRSGNAVSVAGDMNGDGFTDFAVGAPGVDTNGATAGDAQGATYVVFGRAPDETVLRAGSAAAQTIRGGEFTDFLGAVGKNDVLEGRGGGDFLFGSQTTTASYAYAPSAVTANLVVNGLNTGAAAGDIYSNISNLEGSAFADSLIGNPKANVLTGGKGRDLLKGGKGKDVFAYRLAAESLPGVVNADAILDFEPGTATTFVDKIDLSGIDANSAVGGNQAFTFKGPKAITGVGQVALKKLGADVVIQGNTGGSTAPEFEIVLKGMAAKIKLITAKDFKL